MSIKFKNLNNTIVKCKKCPRLVKFIKKITIEKRKQNINEVYWGKPVTGFGDTNAKLLILGLAPAAHGGTRTGRAFTGDKSGEFLFKCLHKAKIANQSTSENLKDGLKLNSTYITNILKCVPPGDKPLNKELNNCSEYFDLEISNLKRLKIIITNLNPSKRPISAVADNLEVRNAKSIIVKTNKKIKFDLLYDKNRSLQKKIKIEQLRKEII